MKLDWKNFIQSEFPNGKLIKTHGKLEYQIDCISENCPNPKNHMFVNLESPDPNHYKKFHCHRCGISGNYKAFLINYFKLPYNEILENLADLYSIDGDPFIIAKTSITKENLFLPKEETPEGFTIDLPKDLKIINDEIKFFKRREIPKKIFKKHKVGICNSGFYKNRIIFPITTKENSSFLAYSQLSSKAIRKWKDYSKKFPKSEKAKRNSRKVLYPLDSLTSMLLFNYDFVKQNTKILFVVEGVFDVLRIKLHGFDAVGYLGSYISEYQAEMISEKNPKEVVFLPDSDVSTKIFDRNFKTLEDHCEDSIVSQIKLKGGDPDDIKSKRKFLNIIKGRKKIRTIFNQQKSLKLF